MTFILNLLLVPVCSFMAYDVFTETLDLGPFFGPFFGSVFVVLAILNLAIGVTGLIMSGNK